MDSIINPIVQGSGTALGQITYISVTGFLTALLGIMIIYEIYMIFASMGKKNTSNVDGDAAAAKTLFSRDDLGLSNKEANAEQKAEETKKLDDKNAELGQFIGSLGVDMSTKLNTLITGTQQLEKVEKERADYQAGDKNVIKAVKERIVYPMVTAAEGIDQDLQKDKQACEAAKTNATKIVADLNALKVQLNQAEAMLKQEVNRVFTQEQNAKKTQKRIQAKYGGVIDFDARNVKTVSVTGGQGRTEIDDNSLIMMMKIKEGEVAKFDQLREKIDKSVASIDDYEDKTKDDVNTYERLMSQGIPIAKSIRVSLQSILTSMDQMQKYSNNTLKRNEALGQHAKQVEKMKGQITELSNNMSSEKPALENVMQDIPSKAVKDGIEEIRAVLKKIKTLTVQSSASAAAPTNQGVIASGPGIKNTRGMV